MPCHSSCSESVLSWEPCSIDCLDFFHSPSRVLDAGEMMHHCSQGCFVVTYERFIFCVLKYLISVNILDVHCDHTEIRCGLKLKRCGSNSIYSMSFYYKFSAHCFLYWLVHLVWMSGRLLSFNDLTWTKSVLRPISSAMNFSTWLFSICQFIELLIVD